MDYTSDALLLSIRDAAYSGTSVRDWPDVAILRLINRQIHEYLLPFILRTRREDFITSADQALVAGQAAYLIPSRASAARIRAVQLVDSKGNPYLSLPEIPLEMAISIGSDALVGPLPLGTPRGYYFRGNQLVLVPGPASLPGISLRVYFPARPSTLVANNTCIRITQVADDVTVLTEEFDTDARFGAYQSSVVCDLVQDRPGFDVLASVTIIATDGTQISFANELPSSLAAGDWVCLAGTAPVITAAAAEVTQGCLINRVVLEILSSKKDVEGFGRRSKLLAMSEKDAEKLLLTNRNAGNSPKAGGGSLHRFRRGGGW